MNTLIKKYCDERIAEFPSISDERKILLTKLADYISEKSKKAEPIHLVYICTHNSRRSHFGQVWAHIASRYFDIPNVFTYSGGTEATAFNINAINALKRVGYNVSTNDEVSSNPVYHIRFDDSEAPIICFSKVYDHIDNPSSGFAAIMTCSDAEQNCPFIPGVELRIGTTYDDPKAFDNTPQQDEKYSERCAQIAREVLFVFSLV
jgi:arsenate reductase (thioredoxin)